MVGEVISVIVTIDDVEYKAETAEVYASLALLSADQTGKNVVTLTTNGPVTALDDIDVFKGTKEVEIDKIDYEDDGAKVTLKNAIVADAEYTVTLTPADEDDEATSATFTGEKAQLTEIRFLNDVLVLADNTYTKGYAYVKGYDQFDDPVTLSGLTVTAGLGDMKAYDPETGKLTLEANVANAYMLVKEVPVFVQVQVGNSVVSGSDNLQVSTRAFVDNIEFGDIEKDGTKRDDERLTITELSSKKYYVELLDVTDQYGNPLSADDLNDQVDDPNGPVLFVIPGNSGAFYSTGRFGTINDTTVLWLEAPADGAKPGTMTLTITGAGGKTFTKDITIEDDPYIDTMNITYPELYEGAGKSNPIEFSAVDQYGDEIDLWQFKPSVVGGDLVFTDKNHMTSVSTTMKVSNAAFNVVTDNTAKKEFEVTLRTIGDAKSMAVFTTTTAGTKVYTGSVTIGEKGTALQIKDTFGSSTQLDRSARTAIRDAQGAITHYVGKGASASLNVNGKIAFEDVNGNSMVRGKDALYPYFTNENLVLKATPANTKASEYTKFAWALTKNKIPDITANTTLFTAAGSANDDNIENVVDADGVIKDTEFVDKADYYVTLFGSTATNATAASDWYKLDQRSIHVTEVGGADNNASFKITAPSTLYIDKNSEHSVKVKVNATTKSGETYEVAADRISLTLDDRFTVSNNEVKGAIGDNWTGDKTGSVEATVWVTSSDNTKVEAGTVTINYTDAAPVATTAKLEYAADVAANIGSFKAGRVGASISGSVSDIELGNATGTTPAAEIKEGKLTLTNGNTVNDTITAQIVDQYGVKMSDTTFYLNGTEVTNASTIGIASRGAVEYRSGNVTNKFYFSDVSNILRFTTDAGIKKTNVSVKDETELKAALLEASTYATAATPYVITTSGTFTLTATTTAIPANTTLVVGSGKILDVDAKAVTIAATGGLTNDGKITITTGGSITNNGKITNNGIIANGGTITQSGTATTGANGSWTGTKPSDSKVSVGTFTIGAMTGFNTPNANVAVGSFTLKDQYGFAFTTAGATVAFSNIKLAGASVTPGATTIVAAGAATAADPSVVTLTTGSAANYAVTAGDTITVTLTDTASTNTFAVVLTYDGTQWTAGNVTATVN